MNDWRIEFRELASTMLLVGKITGALAAALLYAAIAVYAIRFAQGWP